MSSNIFFLSSAGDTNLAKATIDKLIEQDPTCNITVVPLTAQATSLLKEFEDRPQIVILAKEFAQNFEELNQHIKAKGITHAFIGIPSPYSEEDAYTIAKHIDIPTAYVVNEFMFNDPNHPFWHRCDDMDRENIHFAMPLQGAVDRLKSVLPKASTTIIGHLSIDGALSTSPTPKASVSADLQVEDFIFASGTSRGIQKDGTFEDGEFINALLEELATGKHPLVHIRFGLHPAVKPFIDDYLKDLLAVCQQYTMSEQFKIILPDPCYDVVKDKTIIQDSPYILRQNVSGPDAATAASKICQDVPGALLNEGLLRGKPVLFLRKTVTPYLENGWSSTPAEFFTASGADKKTYQDLNLDAESAPAKMAKLMS